jgi:hypothetical protein
MSLKRNTELGCFHGTFLLIRKEQSKSYEKLPPKAGKASGTTTRYFSEVCWGALDLKLLFCAKWWNTDFRVSQEEATVEWMASPIISHSG